MVEPLFSQIKLTELFYAFTIRFRQFPRDNKKLLILWTTKL